MLSVARTRSLPFGCLRAKSMADFSMSKRSSKRIKNAYDVTGNRSVPCAGRDYQPVTLLPRKPTANRFGALASTNLRHIRNFVQLNLHNFKSY